MLACGVVSHRSIENWTLPCSYLQYRKFVHLLAFTRRNHVFQHAKFLVHLRSSPPFDQTMCCLASDLPARSSGARTGLFPLITCLRRTLRLGRNLRRVRGRQRIRLLRLALPRLHLNDLPRSSRRWRQRKVILGNDTTGRIRLALAGQVCGRRRRHWTVRRVGPIGRRCRRARARAVMLLESSWRQIEWRRSKSALFAADIA